jgi:predicted  nucleic acid-binding Zn-ribbon protein
MHIENLGALNHEQLCILLKERLNSTEEWIVTLNNRTKNQAAAFSDLKDQVEVLNVNERMSSMGSCIASLEDSLVEIRQTVNRLTQELNKPVMSVEEAEKDSVIAMIYEHHDIRASKCYQCGA